MEKISGYLNEEDSVDSVDHLTNTRSENSADSGEIWGLIFVHEENILMVEEYENFSTNINNQDFKVGASFTFFLKDTEVRRATVLEVSATKEKIDVSFSKKREELEKGTLIVPGYGKISVASFYKHTPPKTSTITKNIVPPKKPNLKPTKKQNVSKRSLQMEQDPHIMTLVAAPETSTTAKQSTSSSQQGNGNLSQRSTAINLQRRSERAEMVPTENFQVKTSRASLTQLTPKTMVPLYPTCEIEVTCAFLRKLKGRVALYQAKMDKPQPEPTVPPKKRKAAPFPDKIAKDIFIEVLGDGIFQLVFAGRKKKDAVDPKLIDAIEWYVSGLECGYFSAPLSKLFHDAKRDQKTKRDMKMQINRFDPKVVAAKLKKKKENTINQKGQEKVTPGTSQGNQKKTNNSLTIAPPAAPQYWTPLTTSGVNINVNKGIFRAWTDSPNMNDTSFATPWANLNDSASPSWMNN